MFITGLIFFKLMIITKKYRFHLLMYGSLALSFLVLYLVLSRTIDLNLVSSSLEQLSFHSLSTCQCPLCQVTTIS